MQPIQVANVSVVSRELLVVKVVELWLMVPSFRPRPLEPAVVRLRTQHRKHRPRDEHVNVAVQKQRAHPERNKITYNQLHRMAIDGRKRVRRSELVVHFVDIW